MASIPNVPEWARLFAIELGYPEDTPLKWWAATGPWKDSRGNMTGPWIVEAVVIDLPIAGLTDELPTEKAPLPRIVGDYANGKMQRWYWPIVKRVRRESAPWYVEERWRQDGFFIESVCGTQTLEKKPDYDAALQDAWEALTLLRDAREARGAPRVEDDPHKRMKVFEGERIRRKTGLAYEKIAREHLHLDPRTYARWRKRILQ